jgi:hypothetical protein
MTLASGKKKEKSNTKKQRSEKKHLSIPFKAYFKLKPTLIDRAIVDQHPPVNHPLDVHYYSVVDEPQLR